MVHRALFFALLLQASLPISAQAMPPVSCDGPRESIRQTCTLFYRCYRETQQCHQARCEEESKAADKCDDELSALRDMLQRDCSTRSSSWCKALSAAYDRKQRECRVLSDREEQCLRNAEVNCGQCIVYFDELMTLLWELFGDCLPDRDPKDKTGPAEALCDSL